MRFWEITLFLIIINIFGAFFTGVLPSLGFSAFPILNVTTSEVQATALGIEAKYQTGINQEQISSADPLTQALGLLYQAVQMVWNGILGTIKQYVFWLPYLMILYGVPDGFAWGFEVVLVIIQTIGFAQLITGRSLLGVE